MTVMLTRFLNSNSNQVAADKTGAIKVVFGWQNASDALSGRLGLSSCTEDKCERLILDGGGGDWLVRQVYRCISYTSTSRHTMFIHASILDEHLPRSSRSWNKQTKDHPCACRSGFGIPTPS